ncbi:glycosyltransferase family 2 protein [Sulfurovum mangrovi]|uniref:glycosyltransferase family 2 protein n=1 Tax=Sulfurovum mangrovi TaxID=2893889 RepID=UPI001E43FD72|nr:glycosyltransferase [Sulfurovum mangrovi]UFH59365.1 glycosyltransferase [Sulfurovum mangrovi]
MRELRTEEEIIQNWKGDLNKPVVSVCCITYNHELYIEDALEGFLIQETDFPFEILIHDDASTDRTADIIREYEAKYPKLIKPIYQVENQYSKGYTMNPTFNFPRAQGEFIALCEGDDYWTDAEKLQVQVGLLSRYFKLNISIHPAEMDDVVNNHKTIKYYHGNEEKILNGFDAIASLSQFAPTASYLFRSRALKDMPEWFFKEKLPFGDYFIEAIIGKNGLAYLPKTMSVYRRNVSGSYTINTKKMTNDKVIERFEQVIHLTKMMKQMRDIPGEAVDLRIKNIHCDYLNMALYRKSYPLYQSIYNHAYKNNILLKLRYSVPSKNRLYFYTYIYFYSFLTSVKNILRKP